MRKNYVIIYVLLVLVGLFAQFEGTIGIPIDMMDDGSSEIKIGQTGVKNITLIFAEFENRHFNVNFNISRADTNLILNNEHPITHEIFTEEQWYPAMFSIPKIDNPNELQSIYEYLTENQTLSIYDYMSAAIPDFFDNMTQEKLHINIDYVKNPDRVDGLWVISADSLYGTDVYKVRDSIRTAIKDYYGYDYLVANEFENINYLFPQINWRYTALSSGIIQTNANFNETVAVLAHELGHNTLGLLDTGNDYLDEYGAIPYYDAYIDSTMMGRSFTLDGTYNLMYHNGSVPGPYTLYGINPFHTNDLIRQGYIEGQDVATVSEGIANNKLDIQLKAVRNIENTNGYKTAIKIPIMIDLKSTDYYNPAYGSGVESQYFLVEYRNGEGYDEYSPLWHPGESKGILISHIINSDTGMPTVDIEVATPYPKFWSNGEDLFRDPDSSRTDRNGIPISIENGTYYNGKETVDWLDDRNRNPYSPLGGKYAYWRAPTASDAASLPTDFFSAAASDRNKFTPSSNPSTESWKLQDTHIAVYMNGEYGDPADVTVYRNYWSKPIITGTVETISNEGYVGENLIVETGAELILDENSVISIIPNTNMVIQYGSLLKLAEGAKLIVDRSNLTIEDGAIIELAEGAEIVVKGDGKLHATGTIFLNVGNTGNWKGITAETGSSVTLANCEIKSAETGLTATAANVTVTFTSFTDCVNGINLVNCNDLNSSSFNLFGNNFRGLNTGTGIYLTISDGNLRSNTIENFSEGIRFVLSSSIVTKNNIWNNSKYGIVSSGSNAIPFLGNYEKAPGLNNNIINNGPVTPPNISPFPYAQIGIIPIGNVYLKDGIRFNRCRTGCALYINFRYFSCAGRSICVD